MNYTIIKNTRIVGAKGDNGDAPTSDITVPLYGVIPYDGETAPTGYEITTPPAPTPPAHNYLYKWDFTKSLEDEIEGQIATLNGVIRNNNGLNYTAIGGAYLGVIDMIGKTIEVDIESFEFKGSYSNHINFIMNGDLNGYATGALIFRYNSTIGWASYGYLLPITAGSDSKGWSAPYNSNLDRNSFNGKTIKLVYEDEHTRSLYVDDELQGTVNSIYYDRDSERLAIGARASLDNLNQADQCYNMTIKGIRIYNNNEIPLNNFNWDLTQSLVDSGNNATITLSGAVRDQNGVTFDAGTDYIKIPFQLYKKEVYEFDISSMNWQGGSSVHGRLILPDVNNGFIWRKQTQQWELYQGQWYADDSGSTYVTDPNIFSGKTLKMLWDTNGKLCIYANNVLVYRCPLENALLGLAVDNTFMIGSSGAQSYFNMTITGIRIYKQS